MGPLISKEHLEKVAQYVENGLKEGAALAVGGAKPENSELQNGFFYLPTVLTDCKKGMNVVQDEGFGPVITVEKFRKEVEEIDLANVTIYVIYGGVCRMVRAVTK